MSTKRAHQVRVVSDGVHAWIVPDASFTQLPTVYLTQSGATYTEEELRKMVKNVELDASKRSG
jgi:hypothetical protein